MSIGKKTTKCAYCGSKNYGRGCRYAPKLTHVHLGDNTKCIYCGSKNYGKGCRWNPFGKEHVHGVNFNSMLRESEQLLSNLVGLGILSENLEPSDTNEFFKKIRHFFYDKVLEKELKDSTKNILSEASLQILEEQTLEESVLYDQLTQYRKDIQNLLDKSSLPIDNKISLLTKVFIGEPSFKSSTLNCPIS